MDQKNQPSASEERTGAVTIGGKPVTVIGSHLKVGQRAPDFKLIGKDMKEVALTDSRGKVRLLSVVFSLETSVCTLQTESFEERAAKIPGVVVYSISMDLPFTQERFGREHNISNLQFLSDYRDREFGRAYGLFIKENSLLARAVFIVDGDEIIRYLEYLPEVSQAPDYDKAIDALNQIVGECLRP